MTNKRQKVTKVNVNAMNLLQYSQYLRNIYISLDEAFEFSSSLFVEEHKTLP